MSNSLYVVQTNPEPGREREFNAWYTDQHLGDVLRVPGFVSAQRYVRSSTQRDAAASAYEFEYLALYEIEGDSRSALDALGAAVADGLYLSPSMRPGRRSIVFDPITDSVTG